MILKEIPEQEEWVSPGGQKDNMWDFCMLGTITLQGKGMQGCTLGMFFLYSQKEVQWLHNNHNCTVIRFRKAWKVHTQNRSKTWYWHFCLVLGHSAVALVARAGVSQGNCKASLTVLGTATIAEYLILADSEDAPPAPNMAPSSKETSYHYLL